MRDNLLVQGGNDPLLPHFRKCLDDAVSADFAVAFILRSGVSLVREHLVDLLDRGGRIRIVTGDYLDATDPDALVDLLDLGANIDVRVFEAGASSFHPKAYIFRRVDGNGTAFVGSSNLTWSALEGGVEWNYRVLRSDTDQGFTDVLRAFEELLVHPKTRAVDYDWIDSYRKRRRLVSSQRVVEVVEESPEPPPEPHLIQREALLALERTRQAGNEAGLVVMATGLGKTWLAAFDSARDEFQHVLFVAHREEILAQAMHTFRRIRPRDRLGRFSGTEKSPTSDVLFASIQTLGRARHLRQFTPDHFDYIVVDEFHHAAARTYRQLIEHFSPKFLLGLTATPERMDGGDLLTLCQENLVYRKDLVAGIEAKLLCPFNYFGVPDDVDYSHIPWRSSRFDEEELTRAVATTRRAQNALEQYQKHGGRRTLGFCCSQKHADFMADHFTKSGMRAVAVHAGTTSAPRASALEALEQGRLDVIFAVDMFNEGVDVPHVDTVIMLRPTESSVIWMQQFGRGLRQAEGKDVLTVVDYIGNHRTFLVKIRSLLQPLLGTGQSDAEIAAAMRLFQQGQAQLPPGCNVTYELETIDIIRSLLRTRPAEDAILSFYEDFRDRHATRPTAIEVYHAGYNPRSLRKTHGAWTRFLSGMNDLSNKERTSVDAAGDFLDVVETTPMTKSFKMLTLLAMLNRDALPGRITIQDLREEFRRIARRSAALRTDVGEALEHDVSLQSLIEDNPIAAWVGGRGTGGTPYFSYNGTELHSQFSVPDDCRQEFQDLLREIVDWRLAEYLDRGGITTLGEFSCKVIHAQGRPILKLPSRVTSPGIPSGWVDVTANDQHYVAKFAKEYVNVVRVSRDADDNVLADIVRGWFGPDAGKPGTRYYVTFLPCGDGFRMTPTGHTAAVTEAEPWRHYLREEIPPLFTLPFNTALWNQGFVHAEGHLFLLVTLQKSGLNKDHRYDDRFLSPEQFQWQSQNRTTQNSKHGRLIRDHHTDGTIVHLFVRRHKVLDGRAAPFIYCGPVTFVSWEGDAPISIVWKLAEAVPRPLRKALDVPESGA